MLADDRSGCFTIDLGIERGAGVDIDRRSPIAAIAAGSGEDFDLACELGVVDRLFEAEQCVRAAAGRTIRSAADMDTIGRLWFLGRKQW